MTIDKRYLENAMTLEIPRIQRLFRIILPTASPGILTGCTIALKLAFMLLAKEIVDLIKVRQRSVVIHICGQTDKIWSDVADLGIAGLSIDNVASITDCKNTVGSRVKILGNVDPSGIVYSGTPLDVRLGTLSCIPEGYDNPKGYVVMSGCSLPADTTLENIQEMMDTVREVGYPVRADRVDEMIADCKIRMSQRAKVRPVWQAGKSY